jgi:hypothetical protein
MMSRKMLLSLTLFGVSIASAKTYRITLDKPYTVGSQTLTPGEYHVVVSGTTAVLTGPKKEPVKINGKVENQNRKFDQTGILSREQTGKARLDAIEIGGTPMEVNFN